MKLSVTIERYPCNNASVHLLIVLLWCCNSNVEVYWQGTAALISACASALRTCQTNDRPEFQIARHSAK